MVYPVREEAVTIGRSASATIQAIDKRVSRHHCVLRMNRDSYVVEDLGSKNGTRVNGRPVDARTMLFDGAVIVLGTTALKFRIFATPSSTETVTR